jgi:hypothetical protein
MGGSPSEARRGSVCCTSMPVLLELLVIFVVLGLLALLVLGITRMSRAGGRGRGVGVGSVMADLDAILQPHHPTGAVIQKAKEGEEEHDDEGDDKDPGRRPPPR